MIFFFVPPLAGLIRMTPINAVSGWALVIDCISRCAEPYSLIIFSSSPICHMDEK
jgi:putative effector of murein hydrolase LrgA (UPF0299 family)